MITSHSYRHRLVIMVKEPVAGRVKTRLGRDIGMVPAAWWFRHSAARTIRNLTDPRWQTMLAVSPDGARVPWRGLHRMNQGTGDLGARMRRIFRFLPPGPVVIVGSDIPAMTRHHVALAFSSLGSNEVVFGPAQDGGFWLVGLKRVVKPSPRIFEGVRWSSEHALADSLASVGGLSVAMLEELEDVDSAKDLQGFRAEPGRVRPQQ